MECRTLVDSGSEDGPETDVSPQLLSLLNDSSIYARLFDEERRIPLVDKTVRQDLGLGPDQIVGGCCPKVVHGLDGPFPGCPLEEAVRKGHTIEMEFLAPASGRWLDSVIYPTQYRTEYDHDGFFHIIRDITKNKEAQEGLREGEERVRLLLKQKGGIAGRPMLDSA